MASLPFTLKLVSDGTYLTTSTGKVAAGPGGYYEKGSNNLYRTISKDVFSKIYKTECREIKPEEMVNVTEKDRSKSSAF